MRNLYGVTLFGLVVFGCGGHIAATSVTGGSGVTVEPTPSPSASSGVDFGEKGTDAAIVVPEPSSGDSVSWKATRLRTTCDAARELQTVLTASGYSKLSWAASERGLLVETCLELIDNQYRALNPAKRCHQAPPHPSSLADAVVHFFVPREYSARVFVFVVAADTNLNGTMVTSKTPGEFLHLSPVAPTGGLSCHTLPPSVTLWRLVYQYRYRSDASELELARSGTQPTPEGIITHLSQSLLLPVLERISHD